MPAQRNVARLVTWSAAVFTAAGLVLPPVFYFFLTYQRLAGAIEAEVEINARTITQIIAADPNLWPYEQVRISEYLSRRPQTGEAERRRVLDLRDRLVSENVDPLPSPWISRSIPLLDAGAPVGRLEITRSLRPLLVHAALLMLALLPLSGLAFHLLRTVPLRAIERSEEALRRERDTARKYLEVAGVVFVVLNRAGRVSRVNRKGVEILGRTEEEILGRPWVGAFVEPAQRAQVESLMATAVIGGVLPLEYAVLRPSGERRILSWYVTALADERGGSAGLLGSGVDITRQRQLEEQLQNAQKLRAIGQLAEGLAHDFNNTLSTIRGYTGAIRNELPPDDPHRPDLDEILAATDRAAAVTRGLLTFSWRPALKLERMDLISVIRTAEPLLRHLVGSGVELTASLSAEPLWVLADPVQIEQVLVTLISNARDAMPDGGRVVIGVRAVTVDEQVAQHAGLDASGKYAQVSVADTGKGIDPQIQPRLFEPFFTTKELCQGNGMSLAMSYGIIKQHCGAFQVASQPDHGATFTFLLPLLTESTPSPQQSPD